MTKKKSNVAKGRNSYDATIDDSLVAFFNKNITPYATEAGEYNRIMDLVNVLTKQAAELKRRLEITDAVHAAKYDFQVYHGQCYWLCFDSKIDNTRLLPLGPSDWTTGPPDHYTYIARVKWLGDYTWVEVPTTQMSDDNIQQS